MREVACASPSFSAFDTAEQSQDSDCLREHLHSLAAGRSAHLGSGGDLADDFPDRDRLVRDRRDRVLIREAAPLSWREAVFDRPAAGILGLLGAKHISEAK